MRDSRIKPYLFHKQWIPFAEYCDSCFLMLDFDPDKKGKEGQILCYIHDPDEVIYAAAGLLEFVDEILQTLDWEESGFWYYREAVMITGILSEKGMLMEAVKLPKKYRDICEEIKNGSYESLSKLEAFEKKFPH